MRKIDWGDLVSKVVSLIMGGGVVSFLVFWAYLYLTFSSLPVYAIKGLSVVLFAIPISIVLALLLKKWRKWVGRGFLLVCIGVGLFMAWGAYNASIPTVDDRTLMLREYDPFREDTKAVSLNEEPTLKLTEAQVYNLRLDGATALYPVYSAFARAVYPEQDYETQRNNATVTCTNTANAYDRLIKGDVDIIFVAGPSKAQLLAAEQAGKTLHLTPVGKEAFVFFVNSKNPVTGLTVDQVRGIYSGQITNWKEVGGPNKSIRPFQRAENSGSQTALQSLMGDLPIMEPETEDVVGDMGGIISRVASYRNHANAIGFSFRYYSTQMVANDQIRLLALNGVEPTKETIRDGTYPIASEFYAVTASPIGQPAPQENYQPMADFLEWVQGDQGQYLVEETGYVSLHD